MAVDDASVDLVIGNLILEHVSNVAPIFAEAARVLRPGGVMYSCELHPYRQLRGGQAHFTDEWSVRSCSLRPSSTRSPST
jgi:ubiquinone/menaquinone biosynthesis C-methylase UbiE